LCCIICLLWQNQNPQTPEPIKPSTACLGTIDISWVDWAYKSSTCDVMYCQHSAAIYIMVVQFRNTICPPPPQLSLHTRAALSSNSNGTRSVYNRKNPKSSLYCEMSICWEPNFFITVFFCMWKRLSHKYFNPTVCKKKKNITNFSRFFFSSLRKKLYSTSQNGTHAQIYSSRCPFCNTCYSIICPHKKPYKELWNTGVPSFSHKTIPRKDIFIRDG
jgi:hypothetical protein